MMDPKVIVAINKDEEAPISQLPIIASSVNSAKSCQSCGNPSERNAEIDPEEGELSSLVFVTKEAADLETRVSAHPTRVVLASTIRCSTRTVMMLFGDAKKVTADINKSIDHSTIVEVVGSKFNGPA